MDVPTSDPLAEARRLAGEHGLYIVPCEERRIDELLHISYVEAFVVYRENPQKGARGLRLGRRADRSALLRFVKQLAGLK